MTEEINKLFDEAILLEVNVAHLYDLFRWNFPEDASFWARLSIEERNHAALLEAGRDNFKPLDSFPDDLLAGSIKDLLKVNRGICDLMAHYDKIPPSKEEALNVALTIEKSAGELHFQEFMAKKGGDCLDQIFQKLNMDDKDHAKRILAYMRANDINVRQEITCDSSQRVCQ